jgi:hypothetical protein
MGLKHPNEPEHSNELKHPNELKNLNVDLPSLTAQALEAITD